MQADTDFMLLLPAAADTAELVGLDEGLDGVAEDLVSTFRVCH